MRFLCQPSFDFSSSNYWFFNRTTFLYFHPKYTLKVCNLLSYPYPPCCMAVSNWDITIERFFLRTLLFLLPVFKLLAGYFLARLSRVSFTIPILVRNMRRFQKSIQYHYWWNWEDFYLLQMTFLWNTCRLVAGLKTCTNFFPFVICHCDSCT